MKGLIFRNNDTNRDLIILPNSLDAPRTHVRSSAGEGHHRPLPANHRQRRHPLSSSLLSFLFFLFFSFLFFFSPLLLPSSSPAWHYGRKGGDAVVRPALPGQPSPPPCSLSPWPGGQQGLWGKSTGAAQKAPVSFFPSQLRPCVIGLHGRPSSARRSTRAVGPNAREPRKAASSPSPLVGVAHLKGRHNRSSPTSLSPSSPPPPSPPTLYLPSLAWRSMRPSARVLREPLRAASYSPRGPAVDEGSSGLRRSGPSMRTPIFLLGPTASDELPGRRGRRPQHLGRGPHSLPFLSLSPFFLSSSLSSLLINGWRRLTGGNDASVEEMEGRGERALSPCMSVAHRSVRRRCARSRAARARGRSPHRVR